MKKIDSLYFNEIYFKKKKTFIVDYIFVMSTGRKPFIVINTVKDGENVKYESILYDMYNCDGKVEVK